CLRDLPGHLSALRTTSAHLRTMIRQDTKKYLHEVAVQAVAAPTRDIVQRLKVLTGGPRRKQKGTNPLPAIETSPGNLAVTHLEAKQKWISHFSSIEDGHVRDPVDFVHSCYRRQQAKDLSDYSIVPTDIPSLCELEAALRNSEQMHCEAFYRIIRPLITGDHPTDSEVARICAAVQLPSNTMHELRDFIGGPSLVRDAGSSEWADGAVSDTLHDTWFRLPDEPEIIVTRTGSRPGDSLSDLVFSFLFAKVLQQVRQALEKADLLAHIPWSPDMHNSIQVADRQPDRQSEQRIGLSDATWMDDLPNEPRCILAGRSAQFWGVLSDRCLPTASARAEPF
ncbi:CPK1, partial [Symbiodinium sp. CCMP2456]